MSLFLYAENFVTDPAIIVTNSLAPAIHSPYIEYLSQGSAVLNVRGTYSDVQSRTYVIDITYADDTTATYYFAWSDDGGFSYQQTNVQVTGDWQFLNHGMQIQLTLGPQGVVLPVLVAGDRFRFGVERSYGPLDALDLDRETEFHTAAMGAADILSFVFGFGVPKTPRAFIVFDHNSPSTATNMLQASNTSNFATVPYSVTIPWTTPHLLHRIPAGQTYPYWRFVHDPTVATPFFSMSEIYLGGELSLSRSWHVGHEHEHLVLGGSDQTILARGQGRWGLMPERYVMHWEQTKPTRDKPTFDLLWALTHPQSKSVRPFFLWFDTVPGEEIFDLFHWEGSRRRRGRVADIMDQELTLLQVTRTAQVA